MSSDSDQTESELIIDNKNEYSHILDSDRSYQIKQREPRTMVACQGLSAPNIECQGYMDRRGST